MAGETGATTDRLLNRLQYALANKASALTPASGDVIPVADISADYQMTYLPISGLMQAALTMLRIPTQTVAAAGSDQAGAAALIEGFNLVSGPDDAKGVRLPAAVGGQIVIIKVGDGADLKVYPATGDKINAGSANAALTVVDDVCFAVISLDATDWYTLPLLPS